MWRLELFEVFDRLVVLPRLELTSGPFDRLRRRPLVTRARHRVELEAALAALERYGDRASAPELKAEELRIAAHHLGRLTGRIDVEEVLGAIFAEFCIGK